MTEKSTDMAAQLAMALAASKWGQDPVPADARVDELMGELDSYGMTKPKTRTAYVAQRRK